jgi:cell fate regulator YaaT (PSP1 superfamily)
MSCGSCNTKPGVPSGCGSHGSCASGSCNKMNTHDWLTNVPIPGIDSRYPIAEVAFKNGQRKGFYFNHHQDIHTGDMVCVESIVGMDIGKITLSGELVRLQLKKLEKSERHVEKKIVRLATQDEVKRMGEFRNKEKESLIKARAIARSMKLDMKISDVEYQGDGKRAIFYYIADGRVDFRELIKVYAREFNVKVEMKQIGARQEAGLIGGFGSCGRELCCSTWLTDFKNVNINVARYQNLSINQVKLSGQCGRLKCCLNFELDTYLEALRDFPKHADILKTERGDAYLNKTDIFKFLMWYSYKGSTKIYPLTVEQVNEIIAKNKKGEMPSDLDKIKADIAPKIAKEDAYVDVVGQTSLSSLRRTEQRNKSKKQGSRPKPNQPQGNTPKPQQASSATPKQAQPNSNNKPKTAGPKQQQGPPRNNPNQNRPRPNNPKPQGENKPQQPTSNPNPNTPKP